MFFDKNLKSVQEQKNRLAICCDLRRRLFQIEVQGIRYGVRRTISNLTLGLVMAEHIIGFLRERKAVADSLWSEQHVMTAGGHYKALNKPY